MKSRQRIRSIRSCSRDKEQGKSQLRGAGAGQGSSALRNLQQRISSLASCPSPAPRVQYTSCLPSYAPFHSQFTSSDSSRSSHAPLPRTVLHPQSVPKPARLPANTPGISSSPRSIRRSKYFALIARSLRSHRHWLEVSTERRRSRETLYPCEGPYRLCQEPVSAPVSTDVLNHFTSSNRHAGLLNLPTQATKRTK